MKNIELREYFDIGVIVPLEEELIQVIDRFPSIEDRSTETVFCHVVDSGNADITMIVVQQQGMGKMHATNAANYLMTNYELGSAICVGIAGSLSDDMRLSFVCYSGKIADVLDNNKVSDIEDEEASDTEFSPTHYETPDDITQAFGFMRTQPSLRPAYLSWQKEREAEAHKIVEHEVPAPDGKTERIGIPETLGGVLACGMVSKSENYNKKLRKIDRSMLAVETESGGVFSQAKFHGNIPAISIRGVSDYADKDKKRLEAASKGAVRKLAAANAASFLHLQITSNIYFQKALSARRTGRQKSLPLVKAVALPDVLMSSLEAIGQQIDDALRKLSPEFKLQEKGYRLPLPRIRQTPESDGVDRREEQPLDVREVLKTKERIVCSLPRNYPDQSLAWVIASDLLTAELDSRQAVPVVINGEDIRGRHSRFTDIACCDLTSLSKHDGVRLVFIIENMPFSSKHRIQAILDEVDGYVGARCIFLSRGDEALIGESAFTSRSAAIHYNCCRISFLEIAHFIQKNFGMSNGESEVVAKRLRDTFHQFDLDAHPTYFAGIPRETLAALLQANRRSELIQLAVDGFLTFLVAGDTADVSLGRTTRARFLRNLVVEMKLEKRTFDQAELTAFTQQFATRHDFDINAIAFLNGFEEQGILHYQLGRVQISLPFIESYLLASELATKPDLARRYFAIGDDFDYATFDLYTEIGASPEIVTNVIDELKAAIADLRKKNPGEHILLGDEISPETMRKRETTDRLRRRLSQAVDAVNKGTSNGREKQGLIDLHERVREEAGKQQEGDNDETNEKWIERTALLRRATTAWAITTVLLGGGAEHLEAGEKRSISSNLIYGAVEIINEWVRVQKEIDFKALKEALTTDEALRDMPGTDDISEKRRFVSGFIDILEYSALAEPLRRVLNYLSEQARHRVLAPSVEAAEVDGTLEGVLKGTWLIDIDPERGRKPLREAMKKLPRAAFFRRNMVGHYISRVYWAHWKKENRLVLLDAAEDILKPLEVDLNKAQLKRLISDSKTHNESDV